jgi:NAD(P)-dependent dehydrogenase (short-subunit alcohol dehydrogenase family)
MSKRLEGKVALITGAAGGIGAATARCFLEEGARLVLVDSDRGGLEQVGSALRAPERVSLVPGDVSRSEDVERATRAAADRFGGLDVLFANAGVEGRLSALTELTLEDWERVQAVNARGVFLCVKHAAPLLARRGGGSMVLTSSVAGVNGSAGLGAYVASKHAVIGLMKCAALELAPKNIRVNTVNPGPIENRMMRSIEEMAAPGHGETVKANFTRMVPLGRYGTNEEVARLTLFLASDEASYCTGAVFLVDGGFAAQ